MRAPIAIKASLFRRFFFTYLLVILLPVVAASLINYLHSVRSIEREVERSTTTVLQALSQSTDLALSGMRDSVIATLSMPVVRRFGAELLDKGSVAAVVTEGGYDLLLDLQEQLAGVTYLRNMIHSVYLYYRASEVVITPTGAFDSPFFWAYENRYQELDKDALSRLFSGPRMMAFTDRLTLDTIDTGSGKSLGTSAIFSVVTGHPFTSDPDIYLVLNIREVALRRLISIEGREDIRTILVGADGAPVTMSHESPLDAAAVAAAVGRGGSVERLTAGGRNWFALSIRSRFNGWLYIGLVDADVLGLTADLTRSVSLAFILFSLAVGVGLSAVLSGVMYSPIREIRRGLERFAAVPASEITSFSGNDLEVIRRLSDRVALRNRELIGQLASVRPVLQESVVARLVRGGVADPDASRLASLLGRPIPERGFFVVLCIGLRVRRAVAQSFSENEKALLGLEVREKIASALGERTWVAETRRNLVTCLTDFEEPMSRQDIREAAERLCGGLDALSSYLVATVGVGAGVQRRSELAASYADAMRLLGECPLSESCVVIDEDTRPGGRVYEAYLSRTEIERLANVARTLDAERLLEEIRSIFAAHGCTAIPATETINLARDIYNALIRAVSDQGTAEFLLERHTRTDEWFESCASVEDLIGVFSSLLRDLPSGREERGRREQAIRDAAAYIEANYRGNISLEILAERCGMSLGHLSRCFKEVMGEKYVDYVNGVRVRHAKRLLQETDDKVEHVSTAVGYPSPKSFIAIFKKYAGVTPGQYRHLHRAPSGR